MYIQSNPPTFFPWLFGSKHKRKCYGDLKKEETEEIIIKIVSSVGDQQLNSQCNLNSENNGNQNIIRLNFKKSILNTIKDLHL